MKPVLEVCHECVLQECDKRDVHKNSKSTTEYVASGVLKPQHRWECKALVASHPRPRGESWASFQAETDYILATTMSAETDVPLNCPELVMSHGAGRGTS
jgi:hypothetical protein